MLVRTSHCDRDRLQQLLEGSLTAVIESEVERHITDCADCREELEQLAAKADWWQETRDLLVGIDTSKQGRPGRGSAAIREAIGPGADPSDIPSLSFLAPSDNRAMLGRLGEFEVLEFIGRGGMGIVLKGYDHELNRFVAIKVLGTHYAENGAARKRFAREAQAAAAVVHQHVVAIHAVDANHQPPYFVMSFVPGESLQQRLDREGPLAVQDVLRIAQQVAEGLAAAHAQGLVHRDIKPANILLERNVERVLLTDFGLARAVDDASMTQSGIIAGTPQYMSPEQARGEAIDHRADLFSLGSVLYAMLAGHPPFRAESPYGVLRRVTDDVQRPLPEINPAVPEWLDAFIRRLLEKRAESRWQSARNVADLLTRCLAHVQQPTTSKLPSDIAVLLEPRRSTKLRRLIAMASILACIALLAFAQRKWSSVDKRQQVETTKLEEKRSTDAIVARESAAEPASGTASHSPTITWDNRDEADINLIDARLRRLEAEQDF